jgi:anti-anti-sigma factor
MTVGVWFVVAPEIFVTVPLYSCKRCGWATASSWRTAVRAHEVGCPDCSGSVELTPHSGTLRDNVACVESVGTPLEMREYDDLDGALRLVVRGALDIVVVDRLTERLRALVATGRPVRVDLSELGFIDCTGLRTIAREGERARALGLRMEIDRPVSAPVKRVISFLKAESELWPTAAGPPRLRVVDSGSTEATHQRGYIGSLRAQGDSAPGVAAGQPGRSRLRRALDAAWSRRPREAG